MRKQGEWSPHPGRRGELTNTNAGEGAGRRIIRESTTYGGGIYGLTGEGVMVTHTTAATITEVTTTITTTTTNS